MTNNPVLPPARSASRTCTVAEARQNLPALIHETETGAEITITRRGKPVAVLLSAARLEQLQSPGPAPGFWERIQKWRAGTDLAALNIDDPFAGIRDPSPGREPPF